MKTNNNSISFIPVVIYNNVETDKSKILSENKNRAGIYLWTHLDSSKRYIGSAINLSRRFDKYLSKTHIKNVKGNSYIYNALINHGYLTFSLTIIEYIDVKNLNAKEARKLILEREQYYIDNLKPEYNILKIAGSSLGYKHISETLVKMSDIQKSIDRVGENNPMFGKIGENHPMFGKIHSTETLLLMSKALSGENHPLFGKSPSTETRTKLSIAKGGGIIYAYDTQGLLINTFISIRKAAEYFNCSHPTILRYIKSGKLFQDKWILSNKEFSS